METAVTILRELWRRRAVVAVLVLVSIVAGGLVSYKPSLPPESRTYSIGTAAARILLDTPASQAVEVAPKGSEALGDRANLLANLMAQGEVKAAIAKRARLAPDQLVAIGPSPVAPDSRAAKALDDPNASVIQTSVPTDDIGGPLPMIDVEAQAVDARRAAALADAAVAGLEDFLATNAAADQVPDARRLQVRPLGSAQGIDVLRGPSGVLAVIVAMFMFGLLCGLLLLIGALVRGWRVASDVEEHLSDVIGDGWEFDAAVGDETIAGADAGTGPIDPDRHAAGSRSRDPRADNHPVDDPTSPEGDADVRAWTA